MEKIKTLNIYIGGDGGCVDVAAAKLTGYTLVSDKDLKSMEDESEKLKLLSCAKSIAGAKYLVIVTRNNAYEPSYVIHQISFDDLPSAVNNAKLSSDLFPDELVTIEVEGWRI